MTDMDRALRRLQLDALERKYARAREIVNLMRFHAELARLREEIPT